MSYFFCSCNDEEHEHKQRCADNECQSRCRRRYPKWLPYKVTFWAYYKKTDWCQNGFINYENK